MIQPELSAQNPGEDLLQPIATSIRLYYWLETAIDFRLGALQEPLTFTAVAKPDLQTSDCLSVFMEEHACDVAETAIIALLLAPSFSNTLLSKLADSNNQACLERHEPTRTLIPTIGTVQFLVCGNADHHLRAGIMRYFDTDHWFYKRSVFETGPVPFGISRTHRALQLSTNHFDLFLRNRQVAPRFSDEFPAHRLETKMEWEDMILNATTEQRLQEIRNWLENADRLGQDQHSSAHYRKGYRALFHGPSGTGKTLAATLLGKYLQRDVYRVDLSAVISKYIGETSKNLSSLFNTAEDKDWILFFDEGDALFGKRMDTKEADNKNVHYANQDIAYLLQRIEYFKGLVIVSTNFKQNFDTAFARRFNQMILFQPPDNENQMKFWAILPQFMQWGEEVNLNQIVKQYPLTGASIINVIHRATVLALGEGKEVIGGALLTRCIMDEQYK